MPLPHGAGFATRGNGAAQAEAAQQKHGLRVMLIKATPEWYATYFPRYRQAYEDRSIMVVRSEDITADQRLVELHKGKPRMADGRVKGSDGRSRHGATAAAGVIAWSVSIEVSEAAFGTDIAPDMNAFEPENARGRPHATMFRRRSSSTWANEGTAPGWCHIGEK